MCSKSICIFPLGLFCVHTALLKSRPELFMLLCASCTCMQVSLSCEVASASVAPRRSRGPNISSAITQTDFFKVRNDWVKASCFQQRCREQICPCYWAKFAQTLRHVDSPGFVGQLDWLTSRRRWADRTLSLSGSGNKRDSNGPFDRSVGMITHKQLPACWLMMAESRVGVRWEDQDTLAILFMSPLWPGASLS